MLLSKSNYRQDDAFLHNSVKGQRNNLFAETKTNIQTHDTAAIKTQKIQALGSPDQETNRALRDFSAPSDQVHHTGRRVPQMRTRKVTHTADVSPT